MKKLFLILLILPIGLLADDWIFSVENTTMVTAYFNIFNAIAALFKNDSYIDLLRLAFLVGGFFVFAKGVLAAWEGSASANMLSPYGKYLAVGVALLTLIFSRTSTLWIEAKELPTYCPGAPTGTPSTTAFAVELPSVLAYVFKVTNTIGTELTYLAEAAFTNPSNPAGSAAMSDSDGYLGSLKATIGLLNINPSYVTLSKRDATMADKATDFVQDFRMFYQSCITQNNQNQGSEGREQDYKIMNSKDIMKTIDAYIGSNSPNTGFKFSSGKYPGNAYTNIYGVPKTCRTVWADLRSTEGAIAKFATKMCSVYPNMNGGVFELITGTHGTGSALEMTGIGIQAGLINAIKASNKYDSIGIQGGGSFTAGESRATTNLDQLSTASYMAEMIPYLQMTMRAVLYAFFPFVFVVVLLPGGLTVLTQYLQTMIWIELWTPTAAIVNMFINLRVKDTVGEEYSQEGLTLMTSVDMLSEANTIAGVGAVLYLSIPPLTWLILKGSGQMLGGMLSSHSAGFAKNLESNKRGEDVKLAESGRVQNNERASNNMAAISYGERAHYESLREGNQAAGNLLAGMQSGLGADKSAAYQKTGEALQSALDKREALGGDKNVVQSKATSDAVVAKNQQDTNKALGYGNDDGSDFSRIQELSKYQAAQELVKTESGQKFLQEMGVLDNKNEINKDAVNNMTDTQAAEERNKVIELETKQKVLETGIGKDGEAQAKKNANTKAREEKVQLGTNEIVQDNVDDKSRSGIDSVEKIIDYGKKATIQANSKASDRSDTEAYKYLTELTKEMSIKDEYSFDKRGKILGEEEKVNLGISEGKQGTNDRDTRIDSAVYKDDVDVKTQQEIKETYTAQQQADSNAIKKAIEVDSAMQTSNVSSKNASKALFGADSVAKGFVNRVSARTTGIDNEVSKLNNELHNYTTTDGTVLKQFKDKYDQTVSKISDLHSQRSEIINDELKQTIGNKNIHLSNDPNNDSFGALVSVANNLQERGVHGRQAYNNNPDKVNDVANKAITERLGPIEDGVVDTMRQELTDDQISAAIEVSQKREIKHVDSDGDGSHSVTYNSNATPVNTYKEVKVGQMTNAGNFTGYVAPNLRDPGAAMIVQSASNVLIGAGLGAAVRTPMSIGSGALGVFKNNKNIGVHTSSVILDSTPKVFTNKHVGFNNIPISNSF